MTTTEEATPLLTDQSIKKKEADFAGAVNNALNVPRRVPKDLSNSNNEGKHISLQHRNTDPSAVNAAFLPTQMYFRGQGGANGYGSIDMPKPNDIVRRTDNFHDNRESNVSVKSQELVIDYSHHGFHETGSSRNSVTQNESFNRVCTIKKGVKKEAEANPEENESLLVKLWLLCTTKAVSPLLLLLPFAWYAHALEWSAQYVFWLNFFAMIPLASILGDFTEELALHTNQVIGGLINATFGNLVEVVVAIQALNNNEIRVVQASMIGSVFSNLLLVLGCCFFFGGYSRIQQEFNSVGASANVSLLALSSLALVLPTPFAAYYDIEDDRVLEISRLAAVFLILMYAQLMFFQLKTHASMYSENEVEDPELPFIVCLLGLIFMTALITIFSDYLVESIDGFTEESGMSRTFVGLILLPIVGNAVEHITAVTVAMKDKMDLAMGIAVGSTVQIALFVIPFITIYGWIFDKHMTLNFPHFELFLYILSIIIVNMTVSDGSSNWLEGSMLVTTYLMIAVGFWYEEVRDF